MKTICFLLVLLSTIGLTQTDNPVQFNNSSTDRPYDYPKHSIDLKISYWNNSKSGTSIKVPGVEIGTGVSGKLMYNFYPDESYAFNVSVGAMAVEVKAWAFHEYTSAVVPVMMGMKYYFVQSSQSNPFRPYIAGSMGILFGNESSVKILSVKEHMESAMGGYAGIGSDIILGSLVKLHTDIGYNLFTDFSEEIGTRKNYSGTEFSMDWDSCFDIHNSDHEGKMMEKTLQKKNFKIYCEHCKKEYENVWICKMDSVVVVRYAFFCTDCQKLIGIHSSIDFIESIETCNIIFNGLDISIN